MGDYKDIVIDCVVVRIPLEQPTVSELRRRSSYRIRVHQQSESAFHHRGPNYRFPPSTLLVLQGRDIKPDL